MLKSQHWSQHSLYQKKLINSLKSLLNSYRDRIEEYSCLIDRLFYLNLDNAYKVLSPYYSNTGRPAKFQAEILRSLIAMVQLRIYSTNNRYDLPIHFILPQANRHDSVSAVIALSQLKTIYPQHPFRHFIADSAHDNLATYHLCNHYNLSPIIELNPKNKKDKSLSNFDIYSRPICPLSLPMLNWGYNKDRCRIKWRCPVLASKKIKKQTGECPIRDRCSSSNYGRVVYTYPKTNLRLFTNPPRGSRLWNELYSKYRSSSERCIKRILVDYELEKARVYSRKQWLWLIALVCINIHLDAWVDFAKPNIVGKLISRAEEAA